MAAAELNIGKSTLFLSKHLRMVSTFIHTMMDNGIKLVKYGTTMLSLKEESR